MSVVLIAVGVLLVAVALWRLQGAPPEGRRARRPSGAGLADEPAGPGAEAAAGAMDVNDPHSAAWRVLQEPVQIEPGLWEQLARRPALRQFRLGLLLGFGAGLLLTGSLWALWPAPAAQEPPAGGAAAAQPGTTPGGASPGGATQPVTPAGGTGTPAPGTPVAGAGGGQTPGTAPGAQPGTQPGTQPGAGAGTAAPDPGTATAPPQDPPAPGSSGPVTVVVEPGMSAPQIAALLQSQGLIADETAFLDRLAERGLDTLLQAGTFNIPANATLDQVIDLLTAGV